MVWRCLSFSSLAHSLIPSSSPAKPASKGALFVCAFGCAFASCLLEEGESKGGGEPRPCSCTMLACVQVFLSFCVCVCVCLKVCFIFHTANTHSASFQASPLANPVCLCLVWFVVVLSLAFHLLLLFFFVLSTNQHHGHLRFHWPEQGCKSLCTKLNTA